MAFVRKEWIGFRVAEILPNKLFADPCFATVRWKMEEALGLALDLGASMERERLTPPAPPPPARRPLDDDED